MFMNGHLSRSACDKTVDDEDDFISLLGRRRSKGKDAKGLASLPTLQVSSHQAGKKEQSGMPDAAKGMEARGEKAVCRK